MKVKLLACTPNMLEVMYSAARTCYSEKSPIELWEDSCTTPTDKKINLLKKVLGSGHTSIMEHCSVTFAIEGIDRACYDGETEVLTKRGWKFFKDLLKDDEFATINKVGEVQFQRATDFIEFPYVGDMHYYMSQNVNLCVTPNHNLYMKKYDTRKPVEFNLLPSEEVEVKRFYMTKAFNYNPIVSSNIEIQGYSYLRNYKGDKQGEIYTGDLSLPKEYLFPFMAWYLSDGSTYYNERENSYCVSISQTQCEINRLNKTRERIKELIEKLGFTATLDKATVKFKNLTLGKFLKNLGHCNEKYIPWNIFEEFNQPLAKIFIDEYFKGDGHIDKNGCGKLFTSSERLAEQLYQLCFVAGYTCKMHEVGPRDSHYIGENLIVSSKPSYVINVTLTEKGRNKNIVVKKDKHFSTKKYNGKVYCVTVPNHTLFVRRDKVAIWCGNCTHQLVRHRAGIVFSQQSQRYVEIKESKADIMSVLDRYEAPEMQELCDKYFVTKNAADREMCIKALLQYRTLIEDDFRKPEDARAILPNATKTNIVMTCNLRELSHILSLRRCSRAQKPIRELCNEIARILGEKEPWLKPYLEPQCIQLGYCPEGQGCGRKPSLKDVLSKYNGEY